MNKDQKTNLVSFIKEEILKEDNFIAIVHYRGINDKDLYNIRVSLKSRNANLKIIKNSLVKVAIKDTPYETLGEYLKGPSAIAYADEPVGLSKTITEFAKENEHLKIQVGFLNNNILKENDIQNLSKLGSLEEVRASFVGLLQAAPAGFLQILKAPATNIVTILDNYASKQGN